MNRSQPEAKSPTGVREDTTEFTSPGTVSPVLTNYLAMCAPRSRRTSLPRIHP